MQIQNEKIFMKKKYLLGLGAALVLLASCSPAHHYGCRGKRCGISVNAPVKTLENKKQNA
ncbi:hypothetical protein Q765_06600 [Flavobacterium rivuli WB 3.3-2 = DSM 21788]|uniref:Lipoprotein n=2 Tax=Flavobacterium rivuli TaxID=498301 RepID=A0A0A2MG91_9FLAO|nr:hypothetical protein Q765_06600 [Flavobacterium rivuli WB 3.3-2 = DSM 21788]